MTNEEASKILEMFLHKQCDLKRTEFAYSNNDVFHAVKTSSEALEKQKPKKVFMICPIKENYVVEYQCPNCREEIDTDVGNPPKYCKWCGQALDWGEKNE